MRALILDTETTDLIANRTIKIDKLPYILEFYGATIDLSTGEMLNDFSTMIKPPIKVPEEVTKITGITDDMLKDKPEFWMVSDHIADMIQSAPAVIAHNASYDKEIIDIAFDRIGRYLRWPRVICTVEQTVHIKGFRLSLSALHEHLFGQAFSGAHRAKEDVLALGRCATELFKQGMI